MFQTLLSRQLTATSQGTARWVFQKYGLAGFLSELRLAEVVRFARSQGSRAPVGVRRSFNKEYQEDIAGIERWYQSPSLDAAGKADLVFWDGDELVIADFKLSLRLDESGNPKTEYVLQLGTYALIIEDILQRKATIRLELRSPQGQFTRHFSQELRSAVSQELSKLKQTLPRDRYFALDEIATLSAACETCSFRPSCPKYRRALRVESLDNNIFLVPTDCAGRIAKIQVKNEFLVVFIRTLNDDRPLVIKGLPEELFCEELEIGGAFEFIGLRSTEILGRGRAISNLHAVDETSIRDSSFSFSVRRVES